MPKIKRSEKQEKDELFRRLMKKNMALCGINAQKELCVPLGMCEVTMTYKIRDPDKFTRAELRRLFRLLKYSEEEKGLVM